MADFDVIFPTKGIKFNGSFQLLSILKSRILRILIFKNFF